MNKEEVMNGKRVFLSKKGFNEMKQKLEYLKSVKRKEISEKIKQAIAFGDLAENAEYDAAKEQQAFIENEIARLESELSQAEIIDEESIVTDQVKVGCKVTVRNMNNKKMSKFVITGTFESDPENHKISWTSPVGSGLIGHKIGETVAIKIPKGTIKYKIIKIEKGTE